MVQKKDATQFSGTDNDREESKLLRDARGKQELMMSKSFLKKIFSNFLLKLTF